jgi:hypothetical protein
MSLRHPSPSVSISFSHTSTSLLLKILSSKTQTWISHVSLEDLRCENHTMPHWMAAAGSSVVSAHQYKIKLTFTNGLFPSSSITTRLSSKIRHVLNMFFRRDVRFQKPERNRHWRYVRLFLCGSSSRYQKKKKTR